MKFECQSQLLQKGITIVEKAVSQRTTLPVLENIYMELKGGQLRLRGNDLEIGIENMVPISKEKLEGSVLVKAKTISNIVSKLQDEKISIHVDDKKKMVIKGENLDFDIHCLATDEYPVFPNIEQGTQLELKIATLRDMIKHTIFAVSFDETKPFLNGVLVFSENQDLYFVATDGFRLAMRKTVVSSLNTAFSVIVPYKAMNEINKIIQSMDDDAVIKITISENQVAFRCDEFLLVSRVIKGQFPDYKQVLPKETEHTYLVPRRFLIEALERASVIASFSNNVVRLTFNNNKADITAHAAAMGDFREGLEVTSERGSGEVKVAFNVRLILEAIRILDTDDLKLELNGGLSPCMIKPANTEDCIYIIMPIRTSDYQEQKE